MPFRPTTNTKITLSGAEYRFAEHPAAKGMPYGQTGRRATVYQVQSGRDLCALKVFTNAFRTAQTESGAQRIQAFANLPGLQVCSRTVLTRQNNPALLGQYPDLEYAVLMPWVAGQTWQEILLARQPLTQEQSLKLAQNFAAILSNMEKSGLAHCDLSGPNVLVSGAASKGQEINVALVDVEDLYAPGLEKPEKLPGGSAGYGHKTAAVGLWSAEADRFAGAVLLAEMLGWCDERVRRIAVGEQYFDLTEMQQTSERYQILLTVLQERFGIEPDLLTKTWFSNSLDECPLLSDWAQALGMVNTDNDSNLSVPVIEGQNVAVEQETEPVGDAILPLTAQQYQQAAKKKRSLLSKRSAGEDGSPNKQPAKRKIPLKWAGFFVAGVFILASIAAVVLIVVNHSSNTSFRSQVGSFSENTPTREAQVSASDLTSLASDLQVEFLPSDQKNYIHVTSRSRDLDYQITGPVAKGKLYIEPGKRFFVYYHNGDVWAARIGDKGLTGIGSVENFSSVSSQLPDELVNIEATCSWIIVSENPSVGTAKTKFSLLESDWCP